MPRARRSGGYMSAAAARERMTVPEDAPTRARPRTTSGVESQWQPRATVDVATIPVTKPPRDHLHTTEAIHRAARRKRGQRGRAEEDRRPQADDALDAGDEHERRRPDGDGHLQHPAGGGEPRGEEDAVPPDGEVGEACGGALTSAPSERHRPAASSRAWPSPGRCPAPSLPIVRTATGCTSAGMPSNSRRPSQPSPGMP